MKEIFSTQNVSMNAKNNLENTKKERISCITCNNFLETLNIKNPSFPKYDVYECKYCKLGVTHQLPNDRELFDFYHSGFYDRRESELFLNLLEKDLAKIIEEQKLRDARALSQFNFISQYLKLEQNISLRKALDIGCSAGYLLVLLAQHGFDVKGYEPDWKMANLANKRLNKNEKVVISEFLDPDKLEKNYYDLICSSHLLEHISKPTVHLKKLKRALKQDGLLFIEIPNEYSMGLKKCLDPTINQPIVKQGHLFFYSQESISKLLEKCGFKIISLITCGSKANEYFNSSIYSIKLNSLNKENVRSIVHKGSKKIKKYLNFNKYSKFKNQKQKNISNDYVGKSEQGIWIRIIATPI